MATKEEREFLKESNAIEGEYSSEALEDAIAAWEFAQKYKGNITITLIKEIHKRLMRRLNLRIAGKMRAVPVYVGNHTGTSPHLIQESLRELCNTGIWPLWSEKLIKLWHIQFEKIHPFEDGNGRTGRILMNMQRKRVGLPVLIIHTGEEQKGYYLWFR